VNCLIVVVRPSRSSFKKSCSCYSSSSGETVAWQGGNIWLWCARSERHCECVVFCTVLRLFDPDSSGSHGKVGKRAAIKDEKFF